MAGIGASIAEFLLQNFHNVVLIARTEQPLEELRKRYPKQVLVLVGNLGDFSLAQKVVESALENFGKLDGLILNHGMMDPVMKIGTSDIEGWRKLFDVNFFSLVAFVSIERSQTVIFLTKVDQSSYSNISGKPWLCPFHLLGRFNRSILNMGRIRCFKGRNESVCTTTSG